MAQDKTTVRFWLRSDKLRQDGSAPVQLVYQIKQQRKYYEIPGLKILPINWDLSTQEAVYLSKKAAKAKDPLFDWNKLPSEDDVNEMNSKIQAVRDELGAVEDNFRFKKITFDTNMIIDALRERKQPETKKANPGANIVDFINRFINETSEHKPGTKKEYQTLATHLADYEKRKKVKFTFEGDASLVKGFIHYLATKKRPINNITSAKLISTFKTLLRYARKHPYKIKVNPDYFDYSVKRKDSQFEVIALTDDELRAIYDLDLSGSRALDEARDIFCFSCATGFRYGDLKALRKQHIRKDNMIVIPSSDKNSKPIEVPLTPVSFAILQKYSHTQFPLPVTPKRFQLISSSKLNQNIKKIGKMAGIDTEIEKVRPFELEKRVIGVFKKYKLLSIHVGRKTFTTLSLAKGIPLQDVMALTTHSSFAAVKRYIDVTKERKKTVMKDAWGSVNALKIAK